MKRELTPSQHKLFQTVKKAAFLNPFSEERRTINREIAGVLHSSEEGESLLNLVITRVSTELAVLDKEKLCVFKDFSEKDHTILKYTFLFDTYHKYLSAFDELIKKQLTESSSIEVSFADTIATDLKKRGFVREESSFFISMFFQIRRAFYFINEQLIGCSNAMKDLRCALWNNVFTNDIYNYEKRLAHRMEDFSTLLFGETGTGKGTAARAIGMSGFIPFDLNTKRFKKSFLDTYVGINVSQFAESLIESELFGHKKGAFTGAIETHTGILAQGSPFGSIFLDEIGDVAEHIQVKLLQVMQEREFSPVGSYEKIRFAGRIITATNKSPLELRESGGMRNDFYYRISSDVITLPTLRVRIAENHKELDSLVAYITEKIIGARDLDIINTVMTAIKKGVGYSYAWPGNVRELEQSIRRILLHGSYKGEFAASGTESYKGLIKNLQEGHLNAHSLLTQYCSLLYARYGSYEDVARIAGLDRRTVKKYIQ